MVPRVMDGRFQWGVFLISLGLALELILLVVQLFQ